MKRSQLVGLAALAIAENMGLEVGFASKIKSQASYESQLKTLIRALWFGRIDVYNYVDSHSLMIERNFGQAWIAGARDCGVRWQDLSNDELTAFEREVSEEVGRVPDFAQEIVAARAVEGAKVDRFILRASMWANQWTRIKNLASAMACKDRPMKWVMSPLKEHCEDCARMDGRVYRNSVWRKYGILPQSRDLACHGYRCGCRLVPTDEPITPGRPPALVGA